ncbi:ATP-binding protein [Fibrella aquatilis]|uniref:Type IV pili methyl-accepting chemotaxis transducer N-terminal domain-containing protein n=1 Tax=Fibrella aquatilis TaxID=2817059 RepID=A0A939JWS4_9BACT|nr:ATP-binding protein [Fibrella aquatilis]MBO0932212.1 type IV pili methyl-accepting chemotaxis transducer N-terminal domain-containing protein [Fibrella aquatilis]
MLTNRFTFWYRLALTLVACLSLAGCLFVQRQIKAQENDSWLINNAGRQRFQSQLIVKDVLLLTMAPNRANTQAIRSELSVVLARWETYQENLRTGMVSTSSARIVNSDTVRSLFAAVQPYMAVISQKTQFILNQPSFAATSKNPVVTAAVNQILANEKPYLQTMDRLVQQYEEESRQKISQLSVTEWLLLGLTLLVLTLEAYLIFRPAVRALDQSVAQLSLANGETKAVNQTLQETNQTLQETQDKLLRESALRHQQQLNEQIVRMAALMQGQEDERRRLSYDLHDGIGQMLTGQKLLVEHLRSIHLLPEKEQGTYKSLKELILKTIQEVRNVSNNLMPPVLSDFGLEPALRQLAEQQARQTGLAMQVHAKQADARLDKAIEIGVYRIAQEALSNAIKHAQADEIDIDLRLSDNRLLLVVSDNGQGLTNAATKGILNGHGLHNMRERARLLNGVFRLASEPNEGTRVTVTIPLNIAEAPTLETVKKEAV